MTITQTFHRGFTLPTLLIVSTVLMIMGSAILQGTVSVKTSLDNQFYNQLAREAAEAGLRYGQACAGRNATWVQLRPNSTCEGNALSGAPDYVLNEWRYRTRFEVAAIDQRSDGSAIVTSRGITELVRVGADNAVYKTFVETLSEAAGAYSSTVLPDEMALSAHTGGGNMHFLGYDKNVYGAGANSDGQVGDGTAVNRNTPAGFKLPDGVYAQKVVSGGRNVFVLGTDYKVYGAGPNSNGQLGDGSTNDTSVRDPVLFQMPGGVLAKDVVTGGGGSGYTTYVLGTDNRLYAAGANNSRQIANTAVAQYPTPQAMVHGQPVRKMAVVSTANNNNSMIALLNDGRVYGIGANSNRQLGGSTANPVTSFSQLALPSGVLGEDIQVGYYNTYVLGSDGNMYGFGRGSIGQFGNNSTSTPQPTAQRFNLNAFGSGLRVLKMEIGGSSSSAETNSNNQNSAYVLASNHQVYGAGQNHKGQLGNGTSTTNATSLPVRFNIPSGQTAQDVSSLYFTTCVLTNLKRVYCAGENKYGQLGDGTTTDRSTPVQFPLPTGVQALKVEVNYANVYVVGSDGNIYGAGRNTAGELGAGSNTNSSTPVVAQRPVAPDARLVKQVTCEHAENTFALTSDGHVYGAGNNASGQLGDGTTDNRSTPVRFQLPVGLWAQEVECGSYGSAYVLASDNQVYASGANANGQLGDGTNTTRTTPVRVQLPAGLTARKIDSSRGGYVTILASDNQVYGAGQNAFGQLGDGTLLNRNTPVRFNIPGSRTAIDIASNGRMTFAITDDGQVYGAGENSVNHGLLGINSIASTVSTPTRMLLPAGLSAKKLSITTSIAGGTNYVLASDKQVYAMGDNFRGSIGDGTTVTRRVPTRFQLPSGLAAVDIGDKGSTLASDGQVYGSGANFGAYLGDGTGTHRTTPVRYILPSGVHAMEPLGGVSANYVLGSNGRLYASNSTTGTPSAVAVPVGLLVQPGGVDISTYYASETWGKVSMILSDGRSYGFGLNEYGQLGNGTNSYYETNTVPFNIPPRPDGSRIIF